MTDTLEITKNRPMGIHEVINQNARFPNTYYKWQTQFCQPVNGWHGPCRRAMIFRTKQALSAKGGIQ